MVNVAGFCEAPVTGQAAPPEMPGVLTAELWRGQARLYPADCGAAPWFPWAILGLNALPDLAHQAGLRMVGVQPRTPSVFRPARTPPPRPACRSGH